MEIPFVGQTYLAASSNFSAERCLNWFLEQAPGPKPVALLPRPGEVSWADSGVSDAVRGALVLGSRCFVVIGGTLYEASTTGTLTSLGTLNTSTGFVGMAGSQTELAVVDGTYGYRLALDTNVFVAVTDGDFPGADDVAYLDGFFITNDPGTNKMRCSATLDFDSWASADFASAESNPDDIVRVMVDHDELVVFGTRSTEFHFNDGGAGFPFAVIRGSTIGLGLGARWAAVQADNSIFWLADDGVIYRLNGRGPQRVSTHAVESAIRGYSSFSDAYALTYDWDGHKFVVFTFPAGNQTWVFDVATNLWHEAGTFGLGRWRPSVAFKFADKVIVGSSQDGVLNYLDGDTYTDTETVIERMRVPAAVGKGFDFIFHNRLSVDFESGVGLISGQGSAPTVMLSWSDDGGHNWSNEVYASLGEMGNTVARAVWHRLGRSRQRYYKVRVTDPVKTVLMGADLAAAA